MKISLIGIAEVSGSLVLPIAETPIPCGTGFPSPADDYIEKRLDLEKMLIERPAATFFARAHGDSMTGAGIFDGDILIIDKAVPLEERNGRVIVAWLNGEFLVKRYVYDSIRERAYLKSENPGHKPVEIAPEMDFISWGVVTFSIHRHK